MTVGYADAWSGPPRGSGRFGSCSRRVGARVALVRAEADRPLRRPVELRERRRLRRELADDNVAATAGELVNFSPVQRLLAGQACALQT
jgi:hypothetical protein